MFVDVSDDVSVNLNSVISVEVAEQMIGTGVFTLIFTTNVGFRYATGKYTKQHYFRKRSANHHYKQEHL